MGDEHRDFSPAQNERLRQAMHNWRRRFRKNQQELAEAMGVKSPSLSRFVNRNGGCRRDTAEKLAELLGRSVEDIAGPVDALPGEELFTATIAGYRPPVVMRDADEGPVDAAPRGGPAEPMVFRMMSITFVTNLDRMPGLRAWLMNNPTAHLPVWKLAEAMAAYDMLTPPEQGEGLLWWSQFMQPYLGGPLPEGPMRTVSGRRAKYSAG